MPKEVLLYGPIYSWSASAFIEAINESGTEDITLRVNSDGGEVAYGWGMITKFSELKGKKLLKNDGKANSMAAFMFCYADDAEATDVSDFRFHRAGYPSWVESNPEYFTAEMKTSLSRMNANLRKAMEAKMDIKMLEEMKGCTLDEMFSMDDRIEIALTAKEAKKVGLINRIVPLTPKKKAEIEADMSVATARLTGFVPAAKTNQNKTQNKMTLEELKNEHPAAYAAAIEAGEKIGIAKEKARAEVWAHYADVDPKAAKEGIASGKEISQLQMIEFTEKKFAGQALKKVEADAPITPKTDEASAKSETEKQLEEFEKELEARNKK
jgi:ATP-dependent protease ClpP protease subunit